MISVFDYDDYRQYLAAYYTEKKKGNPSYSYKVFTDKAGFKDKSFIYAVIQGTKNLGKSSIFQVSQAIGHNKAENEYFENLVGFTQAKSLQEKNHYFERLKKARGAGKARLLRQDEYAYLSQWYHVVIRSLIHQFGFKDDYAWLAKNVHPSILPTQAKKSVALLERLGLVVKTSGGSYKVVDKSLTTGPEIQSHAALNFHTEMGKLALDAINSLPKDKRFLTGLTLGISRKSYDALCGKLQEFVAEALQLAEKDEDSNSVYQINFQMFPVSNTGIQRRP
ncbi:MAG: TIGR02147 family protein [Fibrobacterota bacterium]